MGWDIMDNCQKCGSKNIVLVEYGWDNPNHYDGTSEIACQDCGARYGRWSGRELKGDHDQENPNERFKV